jgi:NOG1 N-terminal helical domain
MRKFSVAKADYLRHAAPLPRDKNFLPKKKSAKLQSPCQLRTMSQSSASFKNIEPVPSGSDFLDIVLSRTQRRLPTVIRPGFKISRIRSFYARKVKYTQESFTEKLDAILTQFPRLETVHPFHADLVC